jgi:D-serine deaminase-like pyridoxal phosphate-dependent protein
LHPRIVSGGGTGTLLIDSDASPFTELQPGSYPFLDVQYGRTVLTPDGRPWLEAALFVRGRVVSANQLDRVTVDIGMKAMATDAGPPLLRHPTGLAADYGIAGDEHGFLFIPADAQRPGLGATVEMIPGHCDTTVNLYDSIHAVRGDVLEAIWPIGARGSW